MAYDEISDAEVVALAFSALLSSSSNISDIRTPLTVETKNIAVRPTMLSFT